MNPIRSILLHADAATPWAERLAYGADIASALDAQLTTLYAPSSAWAEHPVAMIESPDACAMLQAADEERLRQARTAYAAATRGLAGRLRWTEAGALAPGNAVAGRALAADLLILGQQRPDAHREGEVPRHFVESVVIDSGRPALVVPYIGAPARCETVMVAWKETRESARALTAAIPFLQRARRVFLASWRETDEDAPPGADMAGYLREHGVEVVPKPCGRSPAPVGEAILSLAAALSADLLVMGCYGHWRARERVFGGATRTILDTMTVPVLMAH